MLRIIEKYPDSRKIQHALANGVEQMGQVISGPWSVHLENCRKDVERVLIDHSTPAAARLWLVELEAILRDRAERHLVEEIDGEVNDLRYFAENPMAPERLWAIETLLRLGRMDELQKLLSKDELLAVLPRLQMPAEELREFQGKIEGW